jgi:Tfp pilus assembly protein PilF
MRISLRFLSFMVCAVFGLVLLRPGNSLAETCEKPVAKVVSVQGTVQVKRAGGTQWQQVKLNESYCPGDVIQVGEKSRADVALINQPVLHLDQNSVITLGGMKDERISLISLIKGAAHFFSRVTRGLEVQTAFVNAGVEGTEFFIRVKEGKTVLSVFEGKVLASNPAGRLAITSGQSAVAEEGKAPVPLVVIHPRDAVQWALYYPPVIYYRPDQFQAGPAASWEEMVRKSLEFYWKGDLKGAFSSIEKAPGDIRDPRFFIYRAALLLTVGRVDESETDIRRALSLAPGNSDAFALQSIIYVVRNKKEKALDLAHKAVEAAPDSATARVALSYAQQADFDLKGALKSLQDAVKLEPGNALAWARLSELWLSFGELKKAQTSAQKAVALNPDISRTQTVLGFAFLTEIKIRQSQKAFERAIELDQADPLPRLGLGLSQIREGDLKEGAREIEIAASLDPDNSLIRSYLGKTYFEEKKEKLSSEEYGIAKQLDPEDPTPFFYDAILEQTTNKPVEALHDVQKAIELNDNRAVYRSKLLLDADLAARSASLARIYTDLGFQQLALVEGWQSVNTDPADFSGHRFLADSYTALPRHEIARVSELLQSQLLQPINITPIQPQLAESNLFVISGGGPAELSFNEFNPLFNGNRLALQMNGIAGSHDTVGEEAVASGIYNNASFSVGQFYYKTDGYRENDDVKDTIDNAFFQYSLTPETSIQAEYRYRDTQKGDPTLRFFQDDFLPNERQVDRTNSVRLGFHHSFSPGSELIGNFMYQHADRSVNDIPDPVTFPSLAIKNSEKAYSSELQHLFSSRYIKTIIGAGYFKIDSKDVISTELLIPAVVLGLDPLLGLVPVKSSTDSPRDVRHYNLYLYSYIDIVKNVTFNVGGSADFFKRQLPNGDFDDKNQFNPKLGITWNPVPDTTLRAAVFRALKRTLITDQTLEPTQVAGFNQFFDDENGTESWNYGIAVDQKFSRSIYGGAEYHLRNLKTPFVESAGDVIELRKVGWHEHVGRGYVFWTAYKWLALTAEYMYERLERDKDFANGARNVETHEVPLGVNFFHPSGFSAGLKATYIHQQGSFERQGNLRIFEDGADQFWLFDAAISYRLPKRLGFVTVGGKNLFDRSFQFFDSDPTNPKIQPRRFLFARVTLSF